MQKMKDKIIFFNEKDDKAEGKAIYAPEHSYPIPADSAGTDGEGNNLFWVYPNWQIFLDTTLNW